MDFNQHTPNATREILGRILLCIHADTSSKALDMYAGIISEAESYHGFNDDASHAHKGKTQRNNVMFCLQYVSLKPVVFIC